MGERTKLEELILYLAKRMEEDQHIGRGRIKLAKLLWRSDFGAFWKLGQPITETEYQADQFGPSPVDELLALRDLQEQERLELRNEWDHQQIPVAVGEAPRLDLFSAAEISLVDEQLHQYQHVTAKAMVDEAHEFPGWLHAWNGGKGKHKVVPFESVYWDARTELEAWEHDLAAVLAEELDISS